MAKYMYGFDHQRQVSQLQMLDDKKHNSKVLKLDRADRGI